MFNIPASLVLCGSNDTYAPKETFGRQTSPAFCCCYLKDVFTLLVCVLVLWSFLDVRGKLTGIGSLFPSCGTPRLNFVQQTQQYLASHLVSPKSKFSFHALQQFTWPRFCQICLLELSFYLLASSLLCFYYLRLHKTVQLFKRVYIYLFSMHGILSPCLLYG